MPKASDGGPPVGDVIHIVDPNLRQGFAQVPRPVLKAHKLSDKAKIVYALLLDYAWQEGSCFPGQEKLAEDLGASDRTIRRALDELKTTKLITWKQRGLSQTNVYYILNLAESHIWPSEPTTAEPDRTKMSGPDRSNSSTPNRTKMSAADRTRMSDKEYPADHTHSPRNSQASTFRALAPPRDLSLSKFERANAKEIDEVDRIQNTQEVQQGPATRPSGFEPLGTVLQHSPRAREYQLGSPPAPLSTAPALVEPPSPSAVVRTARKNRLTRPRPGTDATQAIRVDLERYAEELGDEAPLSSTLTRVLHLFEQSELTIGGFLAQMNDARRETLRRSGNIRKQRTRGGPGPSKNRTPYFLSLLADYLGLKEQAPEPTMTSGEEPAAALRAPTREPRPVVSHDRRPAIGGRYVRVVPLRDDDADDVADNAYSGP